MTANRVPVALGYLKLSLKDSVGGKVSAAQVHVLPHLHPEISSESGKYDTPSLSHIAGWTDRSDDAVVRIRTGEYQWE
jgi:hypothetical protein